MSCEQVLMVAAKRPSDTLFLPNGEHQRQSIPSIAATAIENLTWLSAGECDLDFWTNGVDARSGPLRNAVLLSPFQSWSVFGLVCFRGP